MKLKLKVFLSTVTREKAVEWLKRVDDKTQRSMNSAVAKRYAADMKAGRWQPGVAVVAFDTKGKLINGQHVLNALMLSGMPSVRVIMSVNNSPEAYAGFDKNRKRSAKDDLKVQGIDKPTDVASVATVLWRYEKGFFNGMSYTGARGGEQFPTAAEVCEVVEKHPGIHDHLWKNPFRGTGFSLGALRAASYLLHQMDRERAEKFFRSFIEGVEIPTRDHPIAVLRNMFLHPGTGEEPRSRPGRTMAYIFKAWHLYIRGQNVPAGQHLMRKNEPFPELKPLPVVQSISKRAGE